MSTVLTGVAAHALFDLSWLEAILLGAVVASTDAAAVFATLALHAHPPPAGAHARGRVGRQRPDGDRAHARADRVDRAARTTTASTNLALLVVQQLGLGLVVGVVLGVRGDAGSSRACRTSVGAFAPVASLAAAALAFGAADVIGGSGFLAVYLVGLAVGSTPSRYRRQLVAFHEGIAFLAQVALFIVLGLLVFPRELPAVAVSGLALALVLVASSSGRPPSGRPRRSATSRSRAAAARLGRAPRRSADRARDVRALVGRAARQHDLQRRLLRRRRLGDPPGLDAGVGGRQLELLVSRARTARGAARGRRAERARPHRFRRRARPRHRRLCRARARPAAQRDHRRRRAPAATPSRRAGARSSSPGTASSSSPRAAMRPTSRTSSPAGGGASEHAVGPRVSRATPGARIALRSSAAAAYLATRTVALGIVEAPLALAAMTEHWMEWPRSDFFAV